MNNMWILAQAPSGGFVLILVGLPIFVVICFLLLSWDRKKDKEYKQLRKNLQKRLQAKGEINKVEEKWALAAESTIIKSATKNRGKYSPEIQSIIDEEAKQRGLWEYVLYLRGEKAKKTVTPEGILEGFVCEECKGRRLNPATGRCLKCDLPPEDFGYCYKRDKFWSIPPGEPCPEHGNELGRYKAAMILIRLANFVIDSCILFGIGFGIGKVVVPEARLPLLFLLGLLLDILYYIIFEGLWQRTPGKFITGTKVITVTGSKPTLSAIVIRTLTRYVPFEPLSVWEGEKVLGWHDKWAGTYVIKDRPFEREKTTTAQLSPSLLSELSKEKTSGMAIASYVLSFIPLVNILGLIFGFIALAKIKKSRGFLVGRGLALAGIIITFVFLTWLIGLTIIQLPQVEKARVTMTRANLKSLHNAVLQFKMDTGSFPTAEEGLDILIKRPTDIKKATARKKPAVSDKAGDTEKPAISGIISSPISEEVAVTTTRNMGFMYLESKELPKDGWGRYFIYKRHPKSGDPFVIISLGADGKEGGEGYDADLFSVSQSQLKYPFTNID